MTRQPGRTLSGGIAGFAALVMAWPATNARPTAGLDMSYILGIAEARAQGVRFGRDLVFPYGPWGVAIGGSAVHRWQFLVAVLYRFALLAACALGVRRVAAVRGVGPVVAVSIVVLLGAVNAPAELLLVPVFLAAFALRRSLREALTMPDNGVALRRVAWRWVALAVVAVPIGLLTKFNVGIAVVALLAADAIAWLLAIRGNLRELRATTARPAVHAMLPVLLVAAPGVLLSTTALWVAGGQQLGDIGLFLRRSLELTTGFVGSMALAAPSDAFGYLVVVIVVVTSVAVVREWRRSDPLPNASAGEPLVVAALLYLTFRMAYTRMDSGHTYLFVGIAGLCLVPYLVAAPVVRNDGRTALLLVAAAVLAIAQLGQSVTATLDPAVRARELLQALELVARPGARSILLHEARAAYPEAAGLEALLADVPKGARVASIPVETSVVWRFGLRWAQPPLMQRYHAYAPGLDVLDARFLAGPNAPAFVIFQSGRTIDGRLASAESPRAMVELTCRYLPVRGVGTFTLLRRLSASRCSQARDAATFDVANGRPFAVPARFRGGPHHMVLLTIAAPHRGPVAAIRRLLFRPVSPDRIVVGGAAKRLIDSSFGSPIPFTGADGPGDALVTGIVGDVSAMPVALTITGPGWARLHVTLSVADLR